MKKKQTERSQRGLRQRFADWLTTPGGKLRAKISPESQKELRSMILHPMVWVKGADVPEGHVTPWELLIFAFSGFLGSAAAGFSSKQDFLFKEYYRIAPNKLSVGAVISSIWDAANDPVLGSFMDRRRMGPSAWRKIMRISAITGHCLAVVKMLDGGMSDWQHVALLVVCNCLQDIIGTMDSVAGQKLRAGISPYTQQRARTQVWNSVGSQCGYPIANIPMLLMGLRDVFHMNDYQIIVMGTVLMLPFSIVASYLITYIRQRVDFRAGLPANRLPSIPERDIPVDTSGEDVDDELSEELARQEEALALYRQQIEQARKEREEKLAAMTRKERKAFLTEEKAERKARFANGEYELDPETGEPKLSLLQSFSVLKYNRYFIFNTIANFITVFTPSVDPLLIYRYLVPKFTVFGKEVSGEMVALVKEQFVGIPVACLKPFARQMVNACGGPLRVHKLNSLASIIGYILRFLVGYNTFWKLAVNILIESVLYVFADMDSLATTMLTYEMLDYVELKTGFRTEGVTMSVDALFKKIVTNNIGTVTGNAFLQWTRLSRRLYGQQSGAAGSFYKVYVADVHPVCRI